MRGFDRNIQVGTHPTHERASDGRPPNRVFLWCLLVGLIAVCAMAVASTASATTITVDTLSGGSVTGHCSLPDAISAVDNQSAMNNCPAGNGKDTIEFAVTGTISLSSTLAIYLPASATNLTINGPTTGSSGIIIDGASSVQVLQYYSGGNGTLNLNNLTIADGSVNSGYGAGIDNLSNLIITNCTFTSNSATGTGIGGAIYSQANLRITGSTFANNSAGIAGGAIDVNQGIATIINSTFYENSAGATGGGAIANGEEVFITNATFVGNSATGSAASGGVIYNLGIASFNGTILAGSTGGNCYSSSGIGDAGYNISDDGSCYFNATGSENSTAPILGSLSDNGGPTHRGTRG